MALYIKANPKVAQFLGLEHDRNRVKDGNFLLWQADMLAFGRLTDLPLILLQIGAIALKAHEAREEQDGITLRELPVATDPRFVIEASPDVSPDQVGDTDGEFSDGDLTEGSDPEKQDPGTNEEGTNGESAGEDTIEIETETEDKDEYSEHKQDN